MPANRLRTEHWQRSLQQVYERGGGLEISFHRPQASANLKQDEAQTDRGAGNQSNEDQSHLIWRVRILALNDDSIVVEPPSTLGQVIIPQKGVDIVAVIAIGQNRWMFTTQVIGHLSLRSGTEDSSMQAVKLQWPETVERCKRRSFYRISTFELHLPKVTCWPLLDPSSVVVAEKANEIQILSSQTDSSQCSGGNSGGRGRTGRQDESCQGALDQNLTLPEVGPSFDATLVNFGGGGIGILVDPRHAQALARHRLFWLRISLPPELTVPLAVTARLVHTHIDSAQQTYCGLAFEFGHNRSHQQFVVDQICRCVRLQQESQLNRVRTA